MIPSFDTAMRHQRAKVCRYERLVMHEPALAKRLHTARIVYAALELVKEYNCEHLVMSRVPGGDQ